MEKIWIKLWLRLFAVCDVIFCEKFELTTWDKSGRQTSKTKFWKTEIEENIK